MPTLNSERLYAEQQRIDASIHQLMDDGKVELAQLMEEQRDSVRDLYEQALADEKEARNAAAKAPKKKVTLADCILGSRDDFNGMQMQVKNEASVVTIGAPEEYELELESKGENVFGSFWDTLVETAAKGSVNFKQRTAQVGEPDTWTGVTEGSSATKAQVLYKWVDAVAHKETVAGYVPVSKDTLLDYDELYDIINTDLVIDVKDKVRAKGFSGNNNTGIIGIKNTNGILTFTEAMGAAYYDAIRKMRTKVATTARRLPNFVVVSSEIKEAIDLYKTTTGLYQTLGSDTLWGMKVVEDINADGILVYDNTAAKRRLIHAMSVEAGYYNDQFIKNELSILGEQTVALQVRRPDSFCYAAKTDLDKATA